MLLFIDKVTANRDAFAAKVQKVASNLGMQPDWLMSVMNFETGGTFSPSAKNPNSTATGLIQFLQSTAQGLGTSVAALAGMSNVQQLDYVERYYSDVINRHGTIDNITEAYLAVFYPKAIPWGMDEVFPDSVYQVNRLFDENKDGKITKREIQAKILSTIPQQHQLSANQNFGTMNRIVFAIGVLLLISSIYLMWKFKKF